jgi:hypothetical protein
VSLVGFEVQAHDSPATLRWSRTAPQKQTTLPGSGEGAQVSPRDARRREGLIGAADGDRLCSLSRCPNT